MSLEATAITSVVGLVAGWLTGVVMKDGGFGLVWDTGLGVEASGPRIMTRIITVRAGARFRTLPFGYPAPCSLPVVPGATCTNPEKVSETSFAAGLGVPLTRERASLDLSFQRASRSAADVKERGFILSFGLRVSP